MYKLVITQLYGTESVSFVRENGDGSTTSFGKYVDNTDYQRFKTDVIEGAELQDADGNVMSADDAMAFVATLP